MSYPQPANKIKAHAKYEELQNGGFEQSAEVDVVRIIRDIGPFDLDHHECDGNGKDRIAEQDHAFKFKFALDFRTGVVGHAISSEESRNYANFKSTFSISLTILSFDRLPMLPSWVWCRC